MGQFEAEARALYDGRTTFGEFAARTRGKWASLAKMIMRRWRLPCWASEEDVVQDLLVGAWVGIWRWDAARGGLERYLVWTAVDKAKKRAHRVRGALDLHRCPDRAPGRPERPISSVADDDTWAEAILAAPPEQEGLAERALAERRALRACRDRRERVVIRALAREEDLAAGAVRLYADPGARWHLALESEAHAAVVAADVAERVARRIAPARMEA
jgi:DNA-directed RNA polymerase specialized sigma24 family protein